MKTKYSEGDIVTFAGGRYPVKRSFLDIDNEGKTIEIVVLFNGWKVPIASLKESNGPLKEKIDPLEKRKQMIAEARAKLLKRKEKEENRTIKRFRL